MEKKPEAGLKYINEPLKERIKKNSFTNILFYILIFPLAFIITPLILKYTGKEAYGIWAISGTILVFLEFINLQTPTALGIVVPKYDPQKQSNEINGLVNTLFVFYFAAAVLAMLLYYPVKDILISAFFKVDPALKELAGYILTVSVVLYLVNFVLLSFAYLLNSFNISYPANILHIIIGYLRVGATVMALIKGGGIKAVVVIQLASVIVETVILIIWLKIIYPPLKLNPLMFRFKRLYSLLRLSLRIMFTRLASVVNYNIDKLVLGYFLTPVTVVYYQLGATVSKYITTIPEMVSSGSLMPAVSELKHKNQAEKIRMLFERINKYIFMVSLFLMAGIIIFGREFIGLWLGPGYEDTYIVMVFLSAAYTYSLLGVSATQIMNGLEKLNAPMAAAFISAVLNIVLSVVLSKFYGLKGALIGTSTAIFIGTTVMFTVFYRETKIGLNVWEVFIKPVLSAGISFIAVFFIFKYAVVPARWAGFLIKTGTFTLIFGTVDILVFKHLDRYDLDMIKAYIPWIKKKL
jgi:O-antigen/teichoic acid export membrane protein